MNKILRVLNVEDSERDAKLLARHMSRAGYELISKRVDTPAEMKAELATPVWDVILCDYSMPQFDALAALALVKEMGLDIPFIIISGTVGEDAAVEAMRAGAHDYLLKDNLVRLAPTIERELNEVGNRRARLQAEKALKASEAEMRALFAAMSDVILVLDAEGRHLKIAASSPAGLYKPAAEQIGKTLHELFPEEMADLFLDYVRRALNEGRTQGVEYPLSIDGQERWFEGSVSPMMSDSVIWVARDITNRKRAEEEKVQLVEQIENQRLRLNNIVASVPGVVWETWAEPDAATQQINFVSDYVETMLGYTVVEWLSTPNFWLSLVHPDDREKTACNAAADFAGGQNNNTLEFRWVTKDGRVIWVQSNSAVLTDEESRPIGSRGVTIDITQRKHAEEALRVSEERYRLLFSSNPRPMWVYDLETLCFLEVNDAAVHDYGFSREEFLSMTIKDIRPPEDVATLLENVSRVSHGRDVAGIWRHCAKDGRIIDVEITSHELFFAGRCAELVLANDVTERRRTEERRLRRTIHIALRADVSSALVNSEVPLREILEDCTEAIIKHLDAAFARIWTLNQEENMLELQASSGMYTHIDGTHARVPVGSYKIGLIAEEHQPHITNDVQNDPRVSDKGWARREGMIAFAGYPLLVEDRLVGVLAMFARNELAVDTLDALSSIADIISQGIERKRIEEALGKSEEQFRQSQKLEAIGQLAGGIAHDFNNLLTVVNGYSDLTLKRLQTDDPLRRNIEEIRKAGERAATLTRQLLAFSRKQVLQPKVLKINSVVSEIEKMLRRLIGEDIGLMTIIPPELGSIKADPGQIEQVLMNLAVNARDAMPQGGKLTIEAENVYLDEEYARRHIAVNAGPYVMLAVSDDGTGMDEKTQAHIFEPFFTTKGADKGTGLGLSTVYGIVKQSGGNIWVYSEVGLGTTFKIYFPRVDEGVQESKRSTDVETGGDGTETILLAEDEKMVRNLAREVLESYGYQVLEAADGDAAVLVCERHKEPIHLLLTDVVMPEMSGRQLADRLARLRPEMKVIYMSGYTDNAIVHQEVLDEGASFIQKPFAPNTLARTVREVLDEERETRLY